MHSNERKKDAGKKLREAFQKLGLDERGRMSPYRFRMRDGSPDRSPHVFYGTTEEQAIEYATIWADARGLVLERVPSSFSPIVCRAIRADPAARMKACLGRDAGPSGPASPSYN
jgi:hypothetical protein